MVEWLTSLCYYCCGEVKPPKLFYRIMVFNEAGAAGPLSAAAAGSLNWCWVRYLLNSSSFTFSLVLDPFLLAVLDGFLGLMAVTLIPLGRAAWVKKASAASRLDRGCGTLYPCRTDPPA